MSEIEYQVYSLEETKITAYDGDPYDDFGTIIAVSGDGNAFIVGVPYEKDSGSVYVYR